MSLTRLTIISVCLLVCSLHTQGQTVYRNRNYGFSVLQPKGWFRQEAFDKNGAAFYPPVANSSNAEIRVGGGVNQPSEITRDSSQTADEIINSLPEALKEYGHHAVKLVVLRKDHILFAGMHGGLIAIRYSDSQTGKERYVIEADAVHQSGAMYVVGLECEPSESAQSNPIMEGVLRSLAVRKNPRR